MSLLSSLGGLVGMAIGGPTTAFLGATVGSAADGGSLEDALKAGVMGAVGGGSGGPLGGIMNALGGGGNNPLSGIMQAVGGAAGQGGGNQVSQLVSLLGNQGGGNQARNNQGLASILSSMGMGRNQGIGAAAGQGGGLLGLAADNPLLMASLLQATEPRNIKITSELQDRQLATGERDPDFRGAQAMDIRKRNPARFTNRPTYAQGGLIEGPGTGTSDSIPGVIMQNGQPVEEILVSDEEFILRAKDVEKIGNGDRDLGAAKLYALQRRFDNGGTMNG